MQIIYSKCTKMMHSGPEASQSQINPGFQSIIRLILLIVFIFGSIDLGVGVGMRDGGTGGRGWALGMANISILSCQLWNNITRWKQGFRVLTKANVYLHLVKTRIFLTPDSLGPMYVLRLTQGGRHLDLQGRNKEAELIRVSWNSDRHMAVDGSYRPRNVRNVSLSMFKISRSLLDEITHSPAITR